MTFITNRNNLPEYNIFMKTNMRDRQEKRNLKILVQMFRSLGQTARLKILLAIGTGEACVCHLEARMGLRQAYISQHLMALRKAGIVTDRREGRYIFYRLRNPRLLELIQLAGVLSGIPEDELLIPDRSSTIGGCCCPHCVPEVEDGVVGAAYIAPTIPSQ
jgi:DNA-binding transcriptional ArsR family regulator